MVCSTQHNYYSTGASVSSAVALRSLLMAAHIQYLHTYTFCWVHCVRLRIPNRLSASTRERI
jgi:hypothetical protein